MDDNEIEYSHEFKEEVIEFINDFDHVDEFSKFQAAEMIYNVPEMVIRTWCVVNTRDYLLESLDKVNNPEHGDSEEEAVSDSLKKLKRLNQLLTELRNLKDND